MITGIAIENFKGIGRRVDIRLAPITLLFGANSAGKSSILHALHYAYEIFERHNLDVDQTITGGSFVDLGGFTNFVHQHDLSRSVVIRINATVDDPSPFDHELDADLVAEILEDVETEALARVPTSVGVEVVVSWSNYESRPYVAAYRVWLDNEFFVELATGPSGRGASVRKLVLDHPLLVTTKELTEFDEEQAANCDQSVLKLVIDKCRELDLFTDVAESGEKPSTASDSFKSDLIEQTALELESQNDALPDFARSLRFPLVPQRPVNELVDREWARIPKVPGQDLVKKREELAEAISKMQHARSRFAEQVAAAISMLITGAGQVIRQELRSFRYLGPLRETPPRNFEPPRFPDERRWASGLGAWDKLHSGEEHLVAATSDWLGDSDRLNAGCHIERQETLHVPLAHPLIRQILSRRSFDEDAPAEKLDITTLTSHRRLVIVPANREIELQPQDVGIGISQLIPVVVAALDNSSMLELIEQPELHLHPAVQVALGDLFIHATSLKQKTLIVETHSEHLTLRIMRRIRETTTGTLPPQARPILPSDVAMLLVENANLGTTAREMPLNEMGVLVKAWPGGFFEEGLNEVF